MASGWSKKLLKTLIVFLQESTNSSHIKAVRCGVKCAAISPLCLYIYHSRKESIKAFNERLSHRLLSSDSDGVDAYFDFYEVTDKDNARGPDQLHSKYLFQFRTQGHHVLERFNSNLADLQSSYSYTSTVFKNPQVSQVDFHKHNLALTLPINNFVVSQQARKESDCDTPNRTEGSKSFIDNWQNNNGRWKSAVLAGCETLKLKFTLNAAEKSEDVGAQRCESVSQSMYFTF